MSLLAVPWSRRSCPRARAPGQLAAAGVEVPEAEVDFARHVAGLPGQRQHAVPDGFDFGRRLAARHAEGRGECALHRDLTLDRARPTAPAARAPRARVASGRSPRHGPIGLSPVARPRASIRTRDRIARRSCSGGRSLRSGTLSVPVRWPSSMAVGDPQVHLLPLLSQQRIVRRVPNQRVLERSSASARRSRAGARGPTARVGAARAASVSSFCGATAASSFHVNTRPITEASCATSLAVPSAIEPRGQRIAQRRRQLVPLSRVAPVEHRAGHFFDEQRHAVGLGRDLLAELLAAAA